LLAVGIPLLEGVTEVRVNSECAEKFDEFWEMRLGVLKS
jgi:hypothetical protein